MLQCSSIKDKAPHKNKEKKSTLQRNRQDTLYNRIKKQNFSVPLSENNPYICHHSSDRDKSII